jgi:hypothetical protein
MALGAAPSICGSLPPASVAWGSRGYGHRMRRRHLLAAAMVAATLAIAPVAGTASASTLEKGAAPGAWAKSVCTSVGAWLATIEHANAGKAATAATTTPKAAKKALLKLVNASLAATTKLVAKLKKAGAPAVKSGALLASEVRDGYAQVARSLKQSQHDLKRASVKSVTAFLGAARGVEDALESALEHVQAAFNAATNLDIPAMVKAFAAQPACAKLTG